MTKKTQPKSGSEIFVPLNMLKKSPRNVRKTGHTAAEIEGLAASIAANGMLQNLVVEPERDGEGRETGHYFVTIGEGRRLAQLLRAKRRQIRKDEPIAFMSHLRTCLVELVSPLIEALRSTKQQRDRVHQTVGLRRFRQA
ncbi:ParB N-terminal domain-containing protein [Bradyrhizobium sp. CNPSo 4010]|uniref:ParB N-terminal domain-containing protein n=1 Tax=Bradyrhizobium agreste TaxID=2751811 RepID=A0ABS0PGT8_9BRAD|nr:ParB N-terminal domain-containing protein [Bradyrhizobium agreste]